MMRDLRVTFLPQWYTNPYQRLLHERLSAAGVTVKRFNRDFFSIARGLFLRKPDVLHLHWLQPFYEASNKVMSVGKLTVSVCGILALKALGVKLVWTVHNLKNHEGRNPRLDRMLTSFVARRAEAIIAHCETAKKEVMEAFDIEDGRRIHVVPHGHYIGSYEHSADRMESRRSLGIPEDGVMLLFLGQIRPYKGVLELVDAFRRVRNDNAYLVIAGKPLTDDAADIISQRIAGHERIKFIPGFVPDDTIQVYMSACDAVVLPYRDILTSGAAVLAMSFGRACVAPRLGCIKDLFERKGAFLYDAGDTDGLLNAMREAIGRLGDLREFGYYNLAQVRQWGWDEIARRTLDVYRSVTATRARP
jgi:glycosyltransferase involved in cell wall biosynthesis